MKERKTNIEHVNYTSPDKKESEDAWIINHEAAIYGVLDGATPLDEFQDEKGHNGAYLASRIFKEHFESLVPGADLTEEVRAANSKIYQQMLSYGVDVSQGYMRWSTCVAIVQLEDTHFNYVQLGDSIIMAGFKSKPAELLTKDTVKGISSRAKSKRATDRTNGVEVLDERYFDNKLNQLRYNRSLANQPDGYTVANGMKEANLFLQRGKVSCEDLNDVLLVTDGLFHPDYDLLDSYKQIKDMGLTPYINELTKELEERSMPIDDGTAVHLTFSSSNSE
ncbi:Protein phosphatase 2C [Halobacillus alkaliphilus]|uniref:Protein phosphatase 2C n=1 Tax=Halobacillus alkaliphilus TaxID=396056 RepID=A0A1I2T2T5_9BACI|nr:protein phosphatase 2C domain-containing protein [Halobacillus alkaliphilus]SFG56611.1 Protein phosphatase 2C [Halobacillus alkaliphilus]